MALSPDGNQAEEGHQGARTGEELRESLNLTERRPSDAHEDDALHRGLTERERRALLVRLARNMVVAFAVLLILFGGLRSLGQGLMDEMTHPGGPFKKFVFTSPIHHYATASVDLLAGILYAITAIGIFAREPWARRMCLISALVYVGSTGLLEYNEWARLDGNGYESIADTLFWSSFPIIQVVMLLVGARRPRGAGTAAVPEVESA